MTGPESLERSYLQLITISLKVGKLSDHSEKFSWLAKGYSIWDPEGAEWKMSLTPLTYFYVALLVEEYGGGLQNVSITHSHVISTGIAPMDIVFHTGPIAFGRSFQKIHVSINTISCLAFLGMLSFWITFHVPNMIILLFSWSFYDSVRLLCIAHVSCYWEAIKTASLKLMRSLFLQTYCHSHEMKNSNSMNSSFSLPNSLSMAMNNLSVYSYLAYMTYNFRKVPIENEWHCTCTVQNISLGVVNFCKRFFEGSGLLMTMLYNEKTKSLDCYIWVLTLLLWIYWHCNVAEECGQLFHMPKIWFFYGHFYVERSPDPFMYFMYNIWLLLWQDEMCWKVTRHHLPDLWIRSIS